MALVRTTWLGPHLENKIRFALESRLKSVGAKAEKALKRKLGETKFRGRDGTTVRYNPRRRGTPSAPGEPPAIDTGRLRQSVTYQVDKPGMRVRIGTNVDYGLFLERGTTHIAARPWLWPTMLENMAEFRAILLAPVAGRELRGIGVLEG